MRVAHTQAEQERSETLTLTACGHAARASGVVTQELTAKSNPLFYIAPGDNKGYLLTLYVQRRSRPD